MGWALIRGWALINFFCLWDGRLFKVGANSRLGAYSNKYGTSIFGLVFFVLNSLLEIARQRSRENLRFCS